MYIYTYTYIYIHVFISTCINIYIYIYMCTYPHIYIHVYIYTHTRTYLYTYIYIYDVYIYNRTWRDSKQFGQTTALQRPPEMRLWLPTNGFSTLCSMRTSCSARFRVQCCPPADLAGTYGSTPTRRFWSLPGFFPLVVLRLGGRLSTCLIPLRKAQRCTGI